MKLVTANTQHCTDIDSLLASVPEEITEQDTELFFSVVSTELAPWQVEQVLSPSAVYKRQMAVLACHWHPEFVPMDMCRQRIDSMFPNKEEELIIPTQHNIIMSYDNYSGVEVDCYSSGFNQKVQLLLHFENHRVEDAGVLKSMCAHTFKYRSSQLFEFLHALTGNDTRIIECAARDTGADENLVAFVRLMAGKIEHLIDEHWADIPVESIKNKLLRNFFDGLRPEFGDIFINRVQAFLKEVKAGVKEHFSLDYFYRATEFIEETRALGGGIVIPHPEQFWPILLAGYDVDGYEVWNPQSQRYTDFLIRVVNEHNARLSASQRPLLIFMGDDCHMGEKTKPADYQKEEKAAREIGLQPAWDDLNIRKKLIVGDVNRRSVINDYKERLAG